MDSDFIEIEQELQRRRLQIQRDYEAALLMHEGKYANSSEALQKYYRDWDVLDLVQDLLLDGYSIDAADALAKLIS